MIVTLHDVTLHLLPEKALFLPETRILCLADWHLGKAAHFRKAGIPMPQPDLDKEFARVSELIALHDPETVVLLGDVFHSELNNDWIAFESFIRSHPAVQWIITMGNHDIIGAARFESLGIIAADRYVIHEKLFCTHMPLSVEGMLNISGHVHPGCEIYLPARQKFRLPCFYYYQNVLTLPAFGALTGLYIVSPQTESHVYAILGDEVRQLPA